MPAIPTLDYGFAHGADVNYTFVGLGPQRIALNAEETALSDQLIGYWSRFCK